MPFLPRIRENVIIFRGTLRNHSLDKQASALKLNGIRK